MAIEWHFVKWFLSSELAISTIAVFGAGVVVVWYMMLFVLSAKRTESNSKRTCVPHALVGASEDEHLL